MADDRGALREIAWLELFPWLSLVRAVRLAFAPRMLLLAALGLVAMGLGWRAIGTMFSTMPTQPWPWAATVIGPPAPVNELPQSLASHRPPGSVDELLHPLLSPGLTAADKLTEPFRQLFQPTTGAWPFVYWLLCALWSLAVWAAIGGALTRIAALALARESRLGFLGGLRFGVAKWPAYFFAPLVPLAGGIVLILLGLVYGLLMKLNFVALLLSLGWPIMLLASLGVAIVLLGLLFGWALMWPTVSSEGTDAFDAISRSYSYTFQRPLHYLFYGLVAAALGWLAAAVVFWVAEETVVLAGWAVSWGAGADRAASLLIAAAPKPGEEPAWLLSSAHNVLAFWTGCVGLVATAFLYSYFWSAATAIYFLLRQNVDGTERDEVAVEEEAEAEQFGLPPLAADESGVPRVAEPPPAEKPPESGK